VAPDTPVYDALRDALREERPVALATITVLGGDAGSPGPPGGPRLGAKILAAPDGTVVGSLGDPDLDRVVTRDA
jgi:xanthine dehydrogenase accessory factor